MVQLVTGYSSQLFHLLHIIVQRMIRQVDAQHFLFQGKLHVFTEFFDIRELLFQSTGCHLIGGNLEQRNLSLDILFRSILCRFHQAFVAGHMCCPVSFQAVGGTCLD